LNGGNIADGAEGAASKDGGGVTIANSALLSRVVIGCDDSIAGVAKANDESFVMVIVCF